MNKKEEEFTLEIDGEIIEGELELRKNEERDTSNKRSKKRLYIRIFGVMMVLVLAIGLTAYYNYLNRLTEERIEKMTMLNANSTKLLNGETKRTSQIGNISINNGVLFKSPLLSAELDEKSNNAKFLNELNYGVVMDSKLNGNNKVMSVHSYYSNATNIENAKKNDIISLEYKDSKEVATYRVTKTRVIDYDDYESVYNPVDNKRDEIILFTCKLQKKKNIAGKMYFDYFDLSERFVIYAIRI